MTNAVDTDLLTLTRADLVAVLDDLQISHHYYEPNSLGDAPAAWFARPTLTYDQFEQEVIVLWPLVLAGHPIDPENTTNEFDRLVWELWRQLGSGRRAMSPDNQRSITAIEARPNTSTIGDVEYPTYDITVRTTVHIGFC